MSGLCSSWICVPVISNGSLAPMTKLQASAGGVCDNVLLEWMAAVELQTRGDIKAIMPIIIDGGEHTPDAGAFDWSLAQQLAKFEHTITGPDPPGAAKRPSRFPQYIVFAWRFCVSMGAGRLTAHSGGFRPRAVNNCRLHLERERPLPSGGPPLAKTAAIVQDVSAGADDGVSVNGVVAAVLRFQVCMASMMSRLSYMEGLCTMICVPAPHVS